MMMNSNFWRSSFFMLLLTISTQSLAQDEGMEPQQDYSSPSSTPSNNILPPTQGEMPPPKLPQKKAYSDTDKKKSCQKFEGKYIAYYDRVYKVEKCKRREIAVEDGNEPAATLKDRKIEVVDADTIAALEEGLRIGESADKKPNCAKIEGHYILSRGDDLYFIEKCKKHLIPDWDTYTDHASKRGKRSQDIMELAESEFQRIPEGAALPSSLDAEYKKLLKDDSSVDILPLAEACKGLNGKFLSYYSKIYKVEKCHKHNVDPHAFLKRFPTYKIEEMSSEQWVSLPTGKDEKL
jgi:hypothetical protein